MTLNSRQTPLCLCLRLSLCLCPCLCLCPSPCRCPCLCLCLTPSPDKWEAFGHSQGKGFSPMDMATNSGEGSNPSTCHLCGEPWRSTPSRREAVSGGGEPLTLAEGPPSLLTTTLRHTQQASQATDTIQWGSLHWLMLDYVSSANFICYLQPPCGTASKRLRQLTLYYWGCLHC